jgi:hypothetical protein
MDSELGFQSHTQGWKQFISSKIRLINEFDIAYQQNASHKVRTSHGRVAESLLRRWLDDFFPKKYAVTSGYVISAGLPFSTKTPHYDVIIYDCLNSPVLWVEGNHDSSHQGRSRAIPAEYIKAIIEVKSVFNNKNVLESISHLQQLNSMLSGFDDPDSIYKMHLPNDFFCGVVFYELKKKDQFNKGILNSLLEGHYKIKRGFSDCLVLRGENKSLENTGFIGLMESETLNISNLKKPDYSMLNKRYNTGDSKEIFPGKHHYLQILWTENAFSDYFFDMLARLNGTYRIGYASSFHAKGYSIPKDDN